MPRRTIVDSRFPARLRELRKVRGMSYRALANAVPCSHVHLWEIERGSKTPSPKMAARLDTLLGAGGYLRAMVTEQQASARGEGWNPRADQFDRCDAEALTAMLVAETPGPDNALRLAHEWMVSDPPQLYEIRAGRRIGAGTAARIEQRVHQLRLLDDHVGGTDSHTIVSKELDVTAALLHEASYSERTGRRLLAVVGELAQLAGWVASDAGRHTEAQRLYITGAWAAHAGGDTAGAANNLSSLAYQIANVGEPRDAVVLARTAACRVGRDATPTVQALLQERVAWAHARAGEAPACERALGQVEEAYADRRPDDDPAWVYWLDMSEIEIMAGRCWTELERPMRAVPILHHATAGYGDERARETVLYLSWLAQALLQAGEAEEAADVGLRALRLSRTVHSSRADERIDAIHERLHPFRAAAAQEFADAYHRGC